MHVEQTLTTQRSRYKNHNIKVHHRIELRIQEFSVSVISKFDSLISEISHGMRPMPIIITFQGKMTLSICKDFIASQCSKLIKKIGHVEPNIGQRINTNVTLVHKKLL